MKVQEENAAYDEINITPMLDLAYVLLVVFILMTTAAVQGITVNLPKASAAPSLDKPQTKAITITAEGAMFLDTYPVTMEQLETNLQQYKAVNPALPVVIKGDASVQYVKVVDVLALLGKLDITQIGLVTQNLVK
jgi:biopolymer transport protein ExbD